MRMMIIAKKLFFGRINFGSSERVSRKMILYAALYSVTNRSTNTVHTSFTGYSEFRNHASSSARWLCFCTYLREKIIRQFFCTQSGNTGVRMIFIFIDPVRVTDNDELCCMKDFCEKKGIFVVICPSLNLVHFFFREGIIFVDDGKYSIFPVGIDGFHESGFRRFIILNIGMGCKDSSYVDSLIGKFFRVCFQ